MSNNAAATATENKKRKEAFSLWEKTSQRTGTVYLSGSDGIVAFYNTNKKSMKEADITVYQRLNDGETSVVIGNLYAEVSKTGRKYLSGTVSGKPVVGFYGKPDRSPKAPLISVFYKDEYVEDNATPAAEEEELPIQ